MISQFADDRVHLPFPAEAGIPALPNVRKKPPRRGLERRLLGKPKEVNLLPSRVRAHGSYVPAPLMTSGHEALEQGEQGELDLTGSPPIGYAAC